MTRLSSPPPGLGRKQANDLQLRLLVLQARVADLCQRALYSLAMRDQIPEYIALKQLTQAADVSIAADTYRQLLRLLNLPGTGRVNDFELMLSALTELIDEVEFACVVSVKRHLKTEYVDKAVAALNRITSMGDSPRAAGLLPGGAASGEDLGRRFDQLPDRLKYQFVLDAENLKADCGPILQVADTVKEAWEAFKSERKQQQREASRLASRTTPVAVPARPPLTWADYRTAAFVPIHVFLEMLESGAFTLAYEGSYQSSYERNRNNTKGQREGQEYSIPNSHWLVHAHYGPLGGLLTAHLKTEANRYKTGVSATFVGNDLEQLKRHL
ncbi:hypothetical protein J0H58_03165 [bacterium]|nr:hypothetical protein [bacterium]